MIRCSVQCPLFSRDIKSIIHTGKETNNMEEEKRIRETVMSMTPKTANKLGISNRQLYRWKKKIRENKK